MDSPTSQVIQFSLQEARRFVLAWQGLYPPRSWKGKKGLKAFFQRVRSIQFDPINLVGRNPDLVLQSRVVDYQPADVDDLLYKERSLIDSWDKMASLSLTADWPYFSRQRARMEEQWGDPTDVVMTMAPLILSQIKEKGPQSSLDFHIEGKTEWAWGPTRVARVCLEGLYSMGKLGVHHRVGNRRYFDLIENLLPEDLLHSPDPHRDLKAYQQWHVKRRVASLGLAHPNAGEHWGGMIGIKSARRREILQELTAAGELAMITVEGLEGEEFYARQDDLQLIRSAFSPQQQKAAAFIAPLDNLLWDRKNLRRLFDFSYVWEVYKPKHKREYGYYVLPILYGDKFIARFEPRLDRATGEFAIADWWWERGVQVDQEMVNALKECLQAFLTYLSAADLTVSKAALKKSDLEWLKDL